MTVADAQKAVEDLKREYSESEDDGEAHYLADDLWKRTLKAIAGGAQNAATLASVVLEVEKVPFSRYYE